MKEATEPLSARLARHLVASCQCMTKTPDIMWHDQHCRYRVLTEALEVIAPDSFVELLPRDPTPSMFD